MINKKAISILVSFIFLVFLINLVSAGLCKGSDGYYHDCDDFSYRYYNRNFYPNYKTEYYKETSESKSSIESIKEDRDSYEVIKASSSAESSIETYKKERDYSYPKKGYDKYGRDYYDDGYKYKDYYEWDDEPQLVVFVNKVEPIHYRRRANSEDERDRADWGYEYEPSSTWSNWRYAKPYRWREYDNKDDYYYKPRYDEYKQEFNWRW